MRSLRRNCSGTSGVIVLLTASTGQLHYASRSLAIAPPALVFTNSLVPYAWEHPDPQAALYNCFTEAFWQGGGGAPPPALASLPLFRPASGPVFFLKDAEVLRLQALFYHPGRPIRVAQPLSRPRTRGAFGALYLSLT